MDRRPRSCSAAECLLVSCHRCTLAVGLGVASLLGFAIGGCSWLGGDKAEQYRVDNERLIGDFRTEQSRNSVLDGQNRALSDRVAELEQRLDGVSDSLRGSVVPDEAIVPEAPRVSARSAASTRPTAEDPPPASGGATPRKPPADPWRGRFF